MGTMMMGFHYDQGKRIGYTISFPNNLGGKTQLTNVSSKDRARVIREILDLGIGKNEIEILRLENN